MNTADTRGSNNAFVQFGKDIATVITSTLAGYVFVQIISLSIMEKKLHLLFDQALLLYLFSYQMIPPFIAFMVLTASVYFLYYKAKKTMELLHAKEIQSEKEKAALDAVQTVTAMMIDYVAGYNAEIKDWLERKKDKGDQIPTKVAAASKKISLAMQAMSELSYVNPYLAPQQVPVKSYAENLEQRLKEISLRRLTMLDG